MGWNEDAREGQGARIEKERERHEQRKGKWKKIINRYGIILHLLITLHFFYLGTLNGMERGCNRRAKKTYREGKGLTRTKEGQVEEDYRQIQNYYRFV